MLRCAVVAIGLTACAQSSPVNEGLIETFRNRFPDPKAMSATLRFAIYLFVRRLPRTFTSCKTRP